MPPSPGATAFKRGRPVNLLHQTGQGKTQLHDTCRRRDGDRDAGDGAQFWEYLWLTPGRSLLLRLLYLPYCDFRRRMVLARVQDWASSAAVPLMGGPRVGATSNPYALARVSSGGRRGRPGFIHPLGPGTFIRTDHIAQASSRPFADWLDGSALRCRSVVCTLSCLVVTHPVPPVCDQCLQTGGVLWLTPGRSLLLLSLYLPYCDFFRRLANRRVSRYRV